MQGHVSFKNGSRSVDNLRVIQYRNGNCKIIKSAS